MLRMLDPAPECPNCGNKDQELMQTEMHRGSSIAVFLGMHCLCCKHAEHYEKPESKQTEVPEGLPGYIERLLK